MESLESYEVKKRKLMADINGSNVPIGLKKNNSNLFRDRDNGKKKKIDVSNFNQVLSIDKKNLIAETEGMITYDDLVKETLKYELLPTVIPQLKTITIGGAISGLGIESSSFRYGLVHETVLEMEVLLSDGSVVVCTPKNKNKDLFFAIPNSYGTLGYVLKLKVKLMRAKKYVELTHLKYFDSKTYFKDLGKLCEENKSISQRSYDFIDGVVFRQNELYITLGRFADSVPYESNYKYLSIYYKSIKEKQKDYLTTSDYIWRWDTDWFWGSKKFGMQNIILRALFGKVMLNSAAYWKIISFARKFGLDKSTKTESVVQDVGIPIGNCEKFLKFFDRDIGIKPIWVCPFKSPSSAKFILINTKPNKIYIDFGFWDSLKTDKPDGYFNRLVEKKVEELKGMKSLYSTSFYTEKEFWAVHNKKIYFNVKRKYDPSSLLKDLYGKCVKRQ